MSKVTREEFEELRERLKQLEDKLKYVGGVIKVPKEMTESRQYPTIKLPVKKKWKWVAKGVDDYGVFCFQSKPKVINDEFGEHWTFNGKESHIFPITELTILPKSLTESDWDKSLHKIEHV